MYYYHISTLLLIFALSLAAMAAARLGYLFTERFRPLFGFKPFNCRPCLTFHLTWLLMTGTMLAFAKAGCAVNRYNAVFVLLTTLLAAFLNFFMAKKEIKITE